MPLQIVPMCPNLHVAATNLNCIGTRDRNGRFHVWCLGSVFELIKVEAQSQHMSRIELTRPLMIQHDAFHDLALPASRGS